jgi:Virulence factor
MAAMAQVRITCWRDIPVLVTARDDAGEVTVALGPRFQELVDAVAMQTGLSDTEEYLGAWETRPEEERAGSAGDVAQAVAGELEEAFPEIRARHLRPGGPFNAH